jgi:hypothetical protein
MDFAELEAVEGLRWPWHAWPPTASAAASLVVPTSVLCTPLHPAAPDLLPLLPYAPLRCGGGGGGRARRREKVGEGMVRVYSGGCPRALLSFLSKKP